MNPCSTKAESLSVSLTYNDTLGHGKHVACFLFRFAVTLAPIYQRLRMWATPSQLISFHVRHGFLDTAIRLWLRQRLGPTVFVDAILKAGVLTILWLEALNIVPPHVPFGLNLMENAACVGTWQVRPTSSLR